MERVFAFPVFANAAFMGPIFGPVVSSLCTGLISYVGELCEFLTLRSASLESNRPLLTSLLSQVGGFIGQSNLVSWHWCEWITLIISRLILGLVVLFQPEIFTPVLLKWKAAHLRKITDDDRFAAEVEIRAATFWKRLLHALYLSLLLTIREPINILFALYLTVVYIILFTFLDGYTYIFGETYGFSEGITGLSFICIAIGLCGASLLVPLIHRWAKQGLKAIQKEGLNTKLPPEKSLWFAVFGAPAVPISLFWMGWTKLY
jgi:hypothetical protein